MTIKKVFLYLLLLLILAGAIWGYKLVWGKPLNPDHFFERYMIGAALSEPEILTMLGIVDNTWLDFHSHKLTDASPEHTLRGLERNKDYLRTLRRYNRDNLTHQQKITYDTLEWLLETSIEKEPWLFHDFPVNQRLGIQSGYPSFMTSQHQIIDISSAENYIKRLIAAEEKFAQVNESVLHRAELGVIPPRFVFDHVIKEISDFIGQPVEENPLFENLETELDYLEDINTEERQRLLGKAFEAIENEVTNGYKMLIETFDNLYERAGEDVGAWSLPDGDNYYRYLTRMHTTMDISPEDVHSIGMAEVERIQRDMFYLFDELGISGDSIAERFAKLDEDPDLFYAYAENVYDEIIADYTSMIELLYEGSAPLFHRTPQAGVEVQRVPEYMQETAPFAYYNIPAMDGSRPGVFYINLRDINEIPKYGMMSLTAHEAVPGHHFQLALAQEIEGLPMLRKIYPHTAYVEGWALYAEWVISETGFYEDDPLGDLGRLQMEIFRAARLVVDTGIHVYRWNREEAAEYLHRKTGLPMGDVISEVERYVVMPGQALSYKMGMNHIQDLRFKAEDELGDLFDIRDFHEVVLMNGQLPMDILTQVVDHYIETTLGESI